MSTRVLPYASFLNFSSSRMSDFRGRIQPPPLPITQPGPSQNQDQATAAASLLSGQAIQNPSSTATPRSARRNLFGPIDHEENMKLVQAELAKIAESDSRRWNFDFRNEVPLEGRYSWEPTKGADVPPAYEMPNLTARLTQLPTTASTSAVKTITSSSSIVTKSPSPPSSNTTEVSQTPSTTSSSSSNPLRSTLSTVTTATTTVYTTGTIQKQPQASLTTNPNTRKLGTDDTTKIHHKEDTTTTKNNTRQTYITDFLKVRKRPRSPDSSSENKGEGLSGSSSEGRTSPPLLKRAKTT